MLHMSEIEGVLAERVIEREHSTVSDTHLRKSLRNKNSHLQVSEVCSVEGKSLCHIRCQVPHILLWQCNIIVSEIQYYGQLTTVGSDIVCYV